jgi:hypothetical protein
MDSKDCSIASGVAGADADAKDLIRGEAQEKFHRSREGDLEGEKQRDRNENESTSDSGTERDKNGAAPGKESTYRIPGAVAGAGAGAGGTGARLEVEVKGSDMNIIAHAIEFCGSEKFQNGTYLTSTYATHHDLHSAERSICLLKSRLAAYVSHSNHLLISPAPYALPFFLPPC